MYTVCVCIFYLLSDLILHLGQKFFNKCRKRSPTAPPPIPQDPLDDMYRTVTVSQLLRPFTGHHRNSFANYNNHPFTHCVIYTYLPSGQAYAERYFDSCVYISSCYTVKCNHGYLSFTS